MVFHVAEMCIRDRPWMEQWVYIGQALLRQYREDGDFDQWKEMFDILEQYRENGTDGEAEDVYKRQS